MNRLECAILVKCLNVINRHLEVFIISTWTVVCIIRSRARDSTPGNSSNLNLVDFFFSFCVIISSLNMSPWGNVGTSFYWCFHIQVGQSDRCHSIWLVIIITIDDIDSFSFWSRPSPNKDYSKYKLCFSRCRCMNDYHAPRDFNSFLVAFLNCISYILFSWEISQKLRFKSIFWKTPFLAWKSIRRFFFVFVLDKG